MAEISNTTESISNEYGDRSIHAHVEPFHRQARIDGTLAFQEQVATMQHILFTNGTDGRLRATKNDQQGGIWKQTIHSGIGKRPSVDATVRLHYYAYFEHQDEPFDSSFKRRRPLEFRLGKYAVLPGIELAVSTMQRRERAKFIISSDLLYGELGCAPHIPQSAWCLYLIELLSSVEPTNYSSDEQFLMKVNDGHQIDDFAKRIRLAQTLRNAGNEDYAHGNLDRALRNYNKAKQLVQNRVHLIDGQHEEQYHQLLLKLHLNSGETSKNFDLAIEYFISTQCHLRLENYRFCFVSCRDALLIEPNNLKALFRASVSLRMLDRLDEAEKYLAEAIQIDGENQEIQMEATKLAEAKALAAEKSMVNKKSTKNELSLSELDELLATIDVSDEFRSYAETVAIEGDLLESETYSKTELYFFDLLVKRQNLQNRSIQI